MDDGGPPGVAAKVDHLREVTGHTPAVEWVGGRRWRITLRTDRVRMTMDVKVTAGRRAVWAASTLEVDGQPRPLAPDADALAAVMRDPDAVVDLGPMPSPAPVEDAPPQVRHTFRILTGRVGDAMDVALGRDGDRWVIGLRAAAVTMRMTFHRHKRGWQPTIRVVVGGADRSHEVNDDLEAALVLLTDAPRRPAAAAPVIGAPAEGKGFGSVDVRRHAVIRN